MRKTPIHGWHLASGAKMTEFGGWDMPLYYSGILEEHHAVRHAAGLFDISHMGRVRIAGPQAPDLCQAVFTNEAAALKPGRAVYGLVCAPDGGVIDDVIFYREPDGYLAVPNASNREAVVAWLQEVREKRGWSATIEDLSESMGMMSVQGPATVAILEKLADRPIQPVKRFGFLDCQVANLPCRAARTGYTGEDGFEFFCNSSQIVVLWKAILQEGKALGARPAGLGARDSLRIEAALPLYGHELGRERNAALCGLERFIKLDKGDFIGREAIAAAARDASARRLAGFELLERAVPRQGCALERGGKVIGEVASGLFAPTLSRGIGMGFVDPAVASPGTEIQVRIRAKTFAARIVERPFYRRPAPAANAIGKGSEGQ